MHKVLFVRNVKNKKIKPQKLQSIHASVCAAKAAPRKFFASKTLIWLDSNGFGVYTDLVSHNGLICQKGYLELPGVNIKTQKFVQNAEYSMGARVDLCVRDKLQTRVSRV